MCVSSTNDAQTSDSGSVAQQDSTLDPVPTLASWQATALRHQQPTPPAGKMADVVFVIDASGSMRTCFDQLRTHLKTFVEPFRNEGFVSLRLGLMAYSANIDTTSNMCIYRNIVLGGEGAGAMKALYSKKPPWDGLFFTQSGNGQIDVDSFCNRLDGIRCKGDEDTIFALDCAADFPFGPLDTTRRVIVLFTDEKLEEGVLKEESMGEDFALFDKVMRKIVSRHIMLYPFVPNSPASEVLAEYSRVFLEEVPEFRPEGSDTWENIDFSKVLYGMGKSISSSLTSGVEAPFDRAVFGQDKWSDDRWA